MVEFRRNNEGMDAATDGMRPRNKERHTGAAYSERTLNG
jgi:hypothetical protein